MTIAQAPTNRSQASTGIIDPRRRQPPTTRRRWWIIAFLATTVALVIRAPGLYDDVQRRLTASGIAGELTDESMRTLALNVGFYLALMLSILILLLYYSLAATLERHIFRPSISFFGGRVQVGLFFLVALFSTLPVHLVSAAFGVISPKSEPAFIIYLVVIGLAIPFLFLPRWKSVSNWRKALLIALSLGLALLAVAF